MGSGTVASALSRRLGAGQFPKGVAGYVKLSDLHSKTPPVKTVCVLTATQTYFTLCYWFHSLVYVCSAIGCVYFSSLMSSVLPVLAIVQKSPTLTPAGGHCSLIMCFQFILIYVSFIWYSLFTVFHSLLTRPCLFSQTMLYTTIWGYITYV